MNPKIVVALALVAIASQVDAACLCNFPEGTDMCRSGSSCQPMVVRPAHLPKLNLEELSKPRIVCKQVGGLPGFKPIGDLCSCKQAIVVPALVPRPKCPCKPSCHNPPQYYNPGPPSCGCKSAPPPPPPSCPCASSGCSSCSGYPSVNYAPDAIYAAAADPVSLSLAYKAQNQVCATLEDKLAYGFRKLPIDGSKAQAAKQLIPEENLFKMNGQIVEMRPISCKGTMDIDEEALEELTAAELADSGLDCDEGGSVKKLSYGEIGFGPAKLKEVPFVAVAGNCEANPAAPEPIKKCCNDGFIPGNVIIKNTPQEEVYLSRPKCPLSCVDDVVPIRYVSSYSSDASNRDNSNQHYSCGC